LFPHENLLYFVYDTFADLISDSPNPYTPWHQHFWDSGKNAPLLEVNDPVFKQWWTKYLGSDDCCGECPWCWAIEYESDPELSQDLTPASFSRFTSTIFSIVNDFIAISLGQW